MIKTECVCQACQCRCVLDLASSVYMLWNGKEEDEILMRGASVPTTTLDWRTLKRHEVLRFKDVHPGVSIKVVATASMSVA